MTMTLIQTVTLTSAAATIDFNTIPQDANDLLVVLAGRASASTNASVFRINGDSGTNYRYERLYGLGNSVGSDSSGTDNFGLFGNVGPSGSSGVNFGSVALYIANYKSSNAKYWNSDSVAESNATLAPQELIAGRWTGTAAITSLSIYIPGANLV